MKNYYGRSLDISELSSCAVQNVALILDLLYVRTPYIYERRCDLTRECSLCPSYSYYRDYQYEVDDTNYKLVSWITGGEP